MASASARKRGFAFAKRRLTSRILAEAPDRSPETSNARLLFSQLFDVRGFASSHVEDALAKLS
jgi:hypothetical protein